MKALLILKCNDNYKWYRSLIGCTVPYLQEEPYEYKSREPSGYINFVSREDCVIIEGQAVTTNYYEPFFKGDHYNGKV